MSLKERLHSLIYEDVKPTTKNTIETTGLLTPPVISLLPTFPDPYNPFNPLGRPRLRIKNVNNKTILDAIIKEMGKKELSKDDIELSADILIELAEEYNMDSQRKSIEKVKDKISTSENLSQDTIQFSAKLLKGIAEEIRKKADGGYSLMDIICGKI